MLHILLLLLCVLNSTTATKSRRWICDLYFNVEDLWELLRYWEKWLREKWLKTVKCWWAFVRLSSVVDCCRSDLQQHPPLAFWPPLQHPLRSDQPPWNKEETVQGFGSAVYLPGKTPANRWVRKSFLSTFFIFFYLIDHFLFCFSPVFMFMLMIHWSD